MCPFRYTGWKFSRRQNDKRFRLIVTSVLLIAFVHLVIYYGFQKTNLQTNARIPSFKDYLPRGKAVLSHLAFNKSDHFPQIQSITVMATLGKMVKYPGVPPDAFQLNIDYTKVVSSRDLPKILDVDGKTKNFLKQRVCVFNRVPRQRSLWSTNILAMFGSGKYEYISLNATACQFEGTCPSGDVSRFHPECSSSNAPTIGLLEWHKTANHERFQNAIRNQEWDVTVVTGDEYCTSQNSTYGRADFRFFYDLNMFADPENTIIYLPLGPREEFKRVNPDDVLLADKRSYLVNFVGSLTGRTRKNLARIIYHSLGPSSSKSFIHIIQKWAKEATTENGYLTPEDYRKVLLNSTFTLCPSGYNPESYRIFEAVEAGSIPIIVLDQQYQVHNCKHAFAPFIASGAPFVYLNSWYTDLNAFLMSVYNQPGLLIKMQVDMMAWYSTWMKSKASEFEHVLTQQHQARVKSKNR